MKSLKIKSKTLKNSKSSVFKTKAPCRIDLSGGTLDLWPIYLFNEGGLLLNHMALNLYAEADLVLEKSSKFSLRVVSEDLKVEREFFSLEEIKKTLKHDTKKNPLRWILRVTAWCLEEWKINKGSWVLNCRSQVPPGSGLGGSSTLGVALLSTWAKAAGKKSLLQKNVWHYQSTLRDLESVEIEKPAGEQDYVPALLGGLLTLKLSAGQKGAIQHPSSTAKRISSQLGLIYTGKPHHSGINNWSVFTKYLDKDNKILTALNSIHEVSSDLSKELFVKNSVKWKQLIAEEWKHRQQLGKAVNAPVLQQASKWVLSQGAVSTKACGAGGGGCLLVVFKDEKQRDSLMSQELPNKKWKWLPVACAEKGAI